MISSKNIIHALLASSAFASEPCGQLKGCYLWDKTAKTEVMLTGDDSYCSSESPRGWSVRCDTDYPVIDGKTAVIDEIKFFYDGIVQDEYGEPRWMNGDADPTKFGDARWINDVPYLAESGDKAFNIEGRQWSRMCFEKEYKLTDICPPPTTTDSSAVCDTKWTDFIVVDHSAGADEGEIDCGAPNALVSGLQCIDHYCDDLRLYCEQCSSCTYSKNSSYWTQVFSDEHDAAFCGDDHFMTGLSCEGHFCDNLTMQCTKNSGRTSGSQCAWSEWVSEEDGGEINFSEGYVRGIECSGHFCDDKRFWICPVFETC